MLDSALQSRMLQLEVHLIELRPTWVGPGNTKGGSITVPLTSCVTGLDESVLQIKTKIVSSHTADSKNRRSMVQ